MPHQVVVSQVQICLRATIFLNIWFYAQKQSKINDNLDFDEKKFY